MPVAAEIYFRVYQPEERLPVVLIHGAGGDHLYWPKEIRRLPGFRMYALDLPGHGKSGDTGRKSISAYSEAILRWMDAADLTGAVFIGHSMGGAIAQDLALNAAERVLGLGLVASAARLKVAPQLAEMTATPAAFLSAVELIIRWSFSPNAPARLVELAKKRMAETQPGTLGDDFLACGCFDESSRTALIKQPTLVVCGEADKMTPLWCSQHLASTIANARLEIIPDAGHMVMLEQPQAVAAALAGFLSQLDLKN